jgi:hypothetical protein
LTDRTEFIKTARAKFNAYDAEVWVHSFFDENSGGYVVKHTGHKFDPDTGRFEMITVYILAGNGYAVEMLDESDFEKLQYDINIDDIPTEIKVMYGFRNIHKRAEKAAKQGARRIIFYINFDNDKEMFKRFDNVLKTISSIDDIWYIKNGKLRFFIQKKDSPL